MATPRPVALEPWISSCTSASCWASCLAWPSPACSRDSRVSCNPGRQKVYGVHVGWAAFLFILLTHFWWWEFRLVHVHDWTFVVYAFLICYVVLIFLLCTLLLPDDLDEYTGYRDYVLSRRVWFFGLLALCFLRT